MAGSGGDERSAQRGKKSAQAMEVIDCTHERTESMLGLLGGVLQFGMQSMFGFQGAPCDDYRVCPELGYQMQTNLSARKLAEENNSGIFDVHGNF